MRLATIALDSFRCWSSVEVVLPEGATALVGPNGCGKTSILEAAWYAATLGSHRTSSDAVMVREGAEAATVRAGVERGGRAVRLDLEIRLKGRARAQVGGAAVPRRRDVLGTLRAQIFAPERVAIVRGDPGERRRFLDEIVIQMQPRIYGVIRDYERALRQRNALLREAVARGRPPSAIEVWDEALVASGAELSAARARAAALLAPHAASAYLEAGGERALEAAYEPNVPDPGEGSAPEAWADAMRHRLSERRADERIRGTSLVGPHRDDMRVRIGGLPARTHASHGESWLGALALVLGALGAVSQGSGDEPVLLLDDPFTPLDPARRDRLVRAIPPGVQAVATSADPGEVPASFGATVLSVGPEGVVGG